jgi:hypothetical protein
MKRILWMAVAVLTGGCELDMSDVDAETTEAAVQHEALVTNGYASWSSSTPLSLGSDSDRTCFLQGVTGELKAERDGPRAGAQVYRSGGKWWLKTAKGSGSGVMGHATCVPYVVGRKFLSWAGNTGNGSHYSENKNWLGQASVTALTKCFLTEIEVTTGFESSASFVKLQREHIYWNGSDWDSWTIGGNLTREPDNDAGGRAEAVCLEVINDTGYYSWTSGGNGATSSGFAPTSTHACGITQLTGKFASDAFGGINDGVRIFPQDGQWRAFASGGKRISGECYSNP